MRCPVHILARAPQPESVNGSPDDIIAATQPAGELALEDWVSLFMRAVAGKSTARAISAALNGASKRLPKQKFRSQLETANMHSAMLGALDSDWEIANGEQIGAEQFRSFVASRLLAGEQKGFSSDPLVQASDAFLAKEVVSAETFGAMEAVAQRKAFTVANLASKQMLKDTQRELARQVAKGSDLRTFASFMGKRLESAGWTPANPSHVETIFRTNVMGAYNAGRAQQMSEPIVLKLFPLWQIVTVNDGPPRQRPTHQAVHGVVLRADDPWWQTAHPPFGYNCRCRTRSVTEARFGDKVVSGSSISGLPDPGFSSGLGGLLAA